MFENQFVPKFGFQPSNQFKPDLSRKVEPMNIPSERIQTYAPQVQDESAIFSGLSKDEEKKLLGAVGGSITKAKEVYPQYMEQKQDKIFLEERAKASSKMIATATDKKQANKQYKIAILSDYIRENALNEGVVGVSKYNDGDVIASLVNNSPLGQEGATKILSDYMKDGLPLEQAVNKVMGKQEPQQEENQDGIGLGEKALYGTLGTIGTLVGGKVGGEVLKGIGKTVYGLTLPPNIQEAGAMQAYEAGLTNVKPKTTVDTAIKSSLLQKGNKRLLSMADKFGIMGTRSQIGVQAKSLANNMFNDTLKPIFKKSTEEGVKFDYKSLFDKAIEQVKSNTKWSVEQQKSIIDDIVELGKEYKGSTTLENLDLVKRDIANKLPKKYYTGQPMTQTVKDAQGILADVFRKTVHSTIKDKYGVNSAGLYSDYANLQNLANIGKKSMTQGGLQGGAGSFMSTVAQELSTPITTVSGKLTYKVGELLTKLPDKIIEKGKDLLKSGKIKSVVKGLPAQMLAPDFTNINQDTHNTIVNDAKEAIQLLKSGKNIPINNTAYILGKNLSNDEKISQLEKVVNSTMPKKNVSPLEFLIDKLF